MKEIKKIIEEFSETSSKLLKSEEFLKSPLNYTGNKYRILHQIMPYAQFDGENMVDLFCGGATFGINSKYKNVFFVDNNKFVIELLRYLYESDLDLIVKDLLESIDKFRLSNSLIHGYSTYKSKAEDYNPNNGLKEFNSEGFYKLRNHYNSLNEKSSFEAINKLYLLMMYSFNNDIRFSKSGNFNLPVGKTDFNLQNFKKLYKFSTLKKTKNFKFFCSEFDSLEVKGIILKSDFVYIDPPYLITNAVYNESNGWNEILETRLLGFMGWLIEIRKPFILSNVIEKKNACNQLLKKWIKDNSDNISVIDINYHYRSSSYNKVHRDSNEREIIVVYKPND